MYPHFICGDFNLPNIDWTAHMSFGNFAHDHFIDVCNELGLTQHIQSLTHLDGNILYLLLCDASSSSRLLSFDTVSHFSHSCDHYGLVYKISCSNLHQQRSGSSSIPNFKLADYDSILFEFSSMNWNSIYLFCNNNVQDLHDIIIARLHSAISVHVPLKPTHRKPKVPQHIKNLLKEK